MFYIKNILQSLKKIRRYSVKALQFLPFLSDYIDIPKGYYSSSLEYFNLNKSSNENIPTLRYAEFLPSSMSCRNLPSSIYDETHWKFKNKLTQVNPNSFLVCINNGRVVGKQGTVITQDNKLLLDVSLEFGIGEHLNNVMHHQIFCRFRLPYCRNIVGSVAVLSMPGAEAYFHWLTDALPRIEILKKLLPDGLDSIDYFIINQGIPAISESLDLLGIPQEKLLFASSNLHIEASHLIIPSFPGQTGDPPAWAIKFIRDTFLPGVDEENQSNHYLYISRASARYRRVSNEEEVISHLEKMNLNFQVVRLEKYSFREQIYLMLNAKVVISPHGAGLTNLLWCKPRTKVLEIFSPNYVNTCFWAIANQIDIDYYYLIGDEKQFITYPSLSAGRENITVCIDKLEQTLRLMEL